MPLLDNDIEKLFLIVREHWVDADQTYRAYDRGLKSNKRMAGWLARFTVGAACVTAIIPILSAVLQFADPGSPPSVASGILTAIAGSLTAILASVDKAYAPKSNAQEIADQQTKLIKIKLDLPLIWVGLPGASDLAGGTEIMKGVAGQLSDAKKNIQFEIIASDTAEAEAAFEKSPIGLSRSGKRVEPNAPFILTEKPPGFVPIRRKKAA